MLLDEQRVARQAIIEGQAMIVLYDYELTAVGQTVETAPELVDSMRAAMLEDESAPMYANAPIYLREAMLFPYSYGTDFAMAVLAKKGKHAAFAGVFERPPLDTRQVMEPATYLAAEPQPGIKIVPLEKILGPEWSRQDFAGIGEIDLRVILRQWGGKEIAAKLAPVWRGGYYMALACKKATGGAANAAPLPLALVVNFATPEAAAQFAAIYESELPKRYKSVEASSAPHRWKTEEGSVQLFAEGSSVIALESFTEDDAAKLHAAFIPAATAPH
jgi:hypothetical protein